MERGQCPIHEDDDPLSDYRSTLGGIYRTRLPCKMFASGQCCEKDFALVVLTSLISLV